MKLKDKVALITGAGSGLGRAIALAFAREGAKVVVNDIEKKRATQTVADIKAQGGDAFAIAADVSDSQQVKQMFAQAVEKYSTIDILVNNAGILQAEGIATMQDEQWKRMLAVHLDGTFYCTREAVAIMEPKGSGKIINMASIAATTGLGGATHYSAAKGGIMAFTKASAKELIGSGIYVNAIAPGFIDTPGLKEPFGLESEALAELIQAAFGKILLDRLGTPEEIAPVAVFLASDESSFMVGQVISPNGGQVI
jgi:3-oxoacyl-[acyl-carrier protein] reductase